MFITVFLGTVFFSQIFGHFTQPNAIITSPNVAYYVASAILVATLGLFLWHERVKA